MRRTLLAFSRGLAVVRRRRRVRRPRLGPVVLYAAVGSELSTYAVNFVRRLADENFERHAAVRGAVRVAASVEEVLLCRVEQRHAGRSSWRHGLPHRRGDGRARAARPVDRDPAPARAPLARRERDACAGGLQQSEQPQRARAERGRHARRRSQTAGADRRRDLRASDSRAPVEQDGRHGDARKRSRAEPSRGSRRAQGLQLQGRDSDKPSIHCTQRRIWISASSRRFPSHAAMDVSEPGAAEPAAGLQDRRGRVDRAEGALHDGYARQPGCQQAAADDRR